MGFFKNLFEVGKIVGSECADRNECNFWDVAYRVASRTKPDGTPDGRFNRTDKQIKGDIIRRGPRGE